MFLYCTGNVAPVAYLHSLAGQDFFISSFQEIERKGRISSNVSLPL